MGRWLCVQTLQVEDQTLEPPLTCRDEYHRPNRDTDCGHLAYLAVRRRAVTVQTGSGGQMPITKCAFKGCDATTPQPAKDGWTVLESWRQGAQCASPLPESKKSEMLHVKQS